MLLLAPAVSRDGVGYWLAANRATDLRQLIADGAFVRRAQAELEASRGSSSHGSHGSATQHGEPVAQPQSASVYVAA
jgi:hypothetical protein